jgi:hypothetical protein
MNVYSLKICLFNVFISSFDTVLLLQGIYRDGLALLPDLFFHILLNAIWSMYAGDRFSYTDHGHTRFIAQQGINFVRASDPTGRALALTPWIRHIFPQKSGFTQIRSTNIKLVEAIKVSKKKTRFY